MKILVVCDEGNNRSVTIASQLKYWGHDVLTCGLNRNSRDTLDLLSDWADRIITTEPGQDYAILDADKVQLWDVGPDVYPRPFNKDLLVKVRGLMRLHREEYRA